MINRNINPNATIDPNVRGYVIKLKFYRIYRISGRFYTCPNTNIVTGISSLKFKSRINIQSLNFKSMMRGNLLYYKNKKRRTLNEKQKSFRKL